MEQPIDKAGEQYWSDVWADYALTPPIEVEDRKVINRRNRQWHYLFQRIFKNYPAKEKGLIEIGCGGSAWLGYFQRYFGFKLYGLDYSEVGCEAERKILERDGLKGEIIHGDMFAPPEKCLKAFDVVTSFGVIEHFEDTPGTIRTFGALMKDDGIMITSMPNLTGITGWLQKILNRPVYDIHKIMSKKYLENAFKEAGMEIITSEYYSNVAFFINLDPVGGKPIKILWLRRFIAKVLANITLGFWWLEETFRFNFPGTGFFATGVVVISKWKGSKVEGIDQPTEKHSQ